MLNCFEEIPAWKSNHIHDKVWSEITYPFPNFNGITVEIWEWISNFIPTLYWACDYLSILVDKLIHVSKRGPWKMKDLFILHSPYRGCRWPGPVFCLLLVVSSDYAQPITGQVTEVTCPVIGRAQPELTPSKSQKRAVFLCICNRHDIDHVLPKYSIVCTIKFKYQWQNCKLKCFKYAYVSQWQSRVWSVVVLFHDILNCVTELFCRNVNAYMLLKLYSCHWQNGPWCTSMRKAVYLNHSLIYWQNTPNQVKPDNYWWFFSIFMQFW